MITDNEGEASFVVTAKENDKAETITVNFDVAGEFGTHAEGNITLNSEGGRNISGHVKEELEFEYNYPGIENRGATVLTNGVFKIIIQYDIGGSFNEEGAGLTGTLNISNTQVTFENQDLHYYGYSEETRVDEYNNVFVPTGNITLDYPAFNMYGSISNGVCDVAVNSMETLANIKGNFIVRSTAGEVDQSLVYATGNIIVTNSANMLLPFELKEGLQTNESNSVLDTIEFSGDYGKTDIRGYIGYLRNALSLIEGSLKEKTTQTITVA